jgi:hypothetical protein
MRGMSDPAPRQEVQMTYTIQKDRAAIVCYLCGAISYNKHDVDNLYCSGCKRFHADHPPSKALIEAREKLVEQTLGESKTWWQRWMENR